MAGNSWQQPVAGEPSCGTPHRKYNLALDVDPASTAVQTLDLSALVPVGTKAVAVMLVMQSTNAGDYLRICDSGNTEIYGYALAQVANVYCSGYCIAPVDSSRYIYWVINNARVVVARIYLQYYFI